MKIALHLCVALAAAVLLTSTAARAVPLSPAVDDLEDANAPFRWAPTNGVWQIGAPTSGPNVAHHGSNCLATVLNGDYPDNQTSRAEEQNAFVVPAADQSPRLRFWQWFSFNYGYGAGDFAEVQITTDNGATWKALPARVTSNGSGGWMLMGCDLTPYAGQSVRLGFYFEAHTGQYGDVNTAPGWYIDEITVATGVRTLPGVEEFEDGLAAVDRWVADGNNGVWQIGAPTSGPGAAHSGSSCLATTLAGNYKDGTSARAVSPAVVLPPDSQHPAVQFWHWFSFSGGYPVGDSGRFQISTDDGKNWTTLGAAFTGNGGGGWGAISRSLIGYGGMQVKLGFFFVSQTGQYGDTNVAPGWYIDQVQIVSDTPPPPSVETISATGITATGAQLHGIVYPVGQATMAHFQYGTDLALATYTETPEADAGNGTNSTPLDQAVSDLTPGVTYYCRAVASNAGGNVSGAIVAFHGPPTVRTDPAASVTTSSALLKGAVNPNGGTASYYFDFGLTNAYGSKTGTTNLPAGSAEVAVQANTGPIQANRTYQYRLTATGANGATISGANRSFTTAAIPPTVTTRFPAPLSDQTATLRGKLNPNGTPTVYHFEYGLDSTPGAPNSSYAQNTDETDAGSGYADLDLTSALTQLAPDEPYHCRLAATYAANGGGTVYGAEVKFFAAPVPTPPSHLPDPSDSSGLPLRIDTPGLRWRILGTSSWLNDGVNSANQRDPNGVLASVTPGQYIIEFEPKTGVRQPAPRPVVVASENLINGEVLRTIVEPEGPDGGLAVIIEPGSVGQNLTPEERGQWRLAGETDAQWRDGGLAAIALAPGPWLVEFKPVPLRIAIPRRSVLVLPGQTTYVRVFYDEAQDTPQGAAKPELVQTADVTGTPPYCYAGQFQSDAGFGSGIVVKERVVLTAAHVVFDDLSLTYASGLQWRFQREPGTLDPAPIEARGSYLFSGYAGQRRQEVPVDGPGNARQASQQLDAAAVYFRKAAGRNGFTSPLVTDANYDWLSTSRLKTLISYPIDPKFLSGPSGVTPGDAGKLFRTPPANVSFSRIAAAGGAPSQVFQTTQIAGYPGGSGGALCVQFEDGNYYPAAIYIGGDTKVVVRAIDADIVNLIAQADDSSQTDANHTGGGVVRITSITSAGSFSLARLTVNLFPSDGAVAAGGGWQLKGENTFRSSGASIALPSDASLSATYTLICKAVPGFSAPPPFAFQLGPDDNLTLRVDYAESKAPQITTATLPTAVLNRAYAAQVAATNAPTSYTAPDLPALGLAIANNGRISGTPNQTGSFEIAVTAKNATGSTLRVLHLNIVDAGKLTVNFDAARGAIAGATSGVTREVPIAQTVTLTALPKPGFVFNGWGGAGISNVPSGNPKLAFGMSEVVDLAADFIPTPFPALAASYRGLASDPAGGPLFETSGVASITVTAAGVATGSVTVGGVTRTFKGPLLPDGTFRGLATAADKSQLQVSLAADLDSHTGMAGTLALDQQTSVSFLARRAFKTAPAATYTVELPRDASHPGVAYPQASSVATLRVAAGGAVSAQLYLADGARTAAGGFLTESAAAGIPDCPLFAELYDHKGAILGDVAFAQASPPQLSGATRWFRKAGAASGPFVAGWPAGGLISNAQGYTWVKPHAATHTAAAVTPLNGLSPTGGNVHLDLGSTGFDLQLSGLGRFTVSPSDASKLSLTLNPATGLLTGTYHAPAGPQSFTGILAQPRTPAGTATGFLLTPTSTSTLSLSLSP